MAVVEAVVSYLVNRLGDHLIREASFLLGIGDQLEWVQSQFRWMQAFLKDAEARSHEDERVKQWMREVRGVAYLAEDIIDTYFLQIAPLRQPGFSGAIRRQAFLFTEIHARDKLVSKIEKMKGKINSILQSRVAYGIQDVRHEEGTCSSGQSLTDRRRLSSPHVEEPDFVGFQTDLETLICRLNQGEQRLSVISIVGMGGLGKTTLASKVYQSDAVKRHFHPCVWISVSQVYAVKELLLVVMKSCMGLSKKELKMMEKADAVVLCLKIAEHLRGKTYLVVLDDVWTREAWDALRGAFPDTTNGSRVLLTTRNKEVALRADASSQPHELRFLNQDESWELFLKKAFLGCEASFPIDPEPLRKEILGKCQGLPLAIVVIGGLLSRRKEPMQWQNILGSLGWQLIEGEDRISGILALSYRDLPYYLKPCFLYLGVFPEDKEIPAKKLIRLWVAEGFLQERGALTLEQVGEEFLHELIQRCMIQVSARSSSGGIKSCRIHDLLRDLALSEANKDEFLEVSGGSLATPSTTCTGRRLALHYDEMRFDSLNRSAPNLRSLLIPSQQEFNRKEMKLVCGSFKLLRVLDIVCVLVEKLPSEVGKLIHLRYLGCRCEKFESFSSNIGNLVYLEILSLSSSSSSLDRETIPIAIRKMKQLRHVRLRGENCWIKIKGNPRVDHLPCSHSLHTLANVLAGDWMNDGRLERLTKLRKLGINIEPMIGRGCVETAWESIMRLKSLESLYVSAIQRGGLGRVPALNHLPKLCKLRLDGKLEASVLCELPRNLTKLTLDSSRLKQDPLPILEKVENLRILKMFGSYDGEKMACTAGGFPQLQYLHLSGLTLREWRVEKGSMPCLSHLCIDFCLRLVEVPEGLQHVTSLKTLKLWMPPNFTERVRRDGGGDWHKVQHIPSITCRWAIDLANMHDHHMLNW